MNQDITKPYTANRTVLYNLTERNDPSIRNLKWSLNPQLNCSKEKHLPKIQQFKEYNFIKRDKEKIEQYKNNYLETDNIAIRVPDFVKDKHKLNERTKSEDFTMQKIFKTPFLDMKNEFNVNTLSDSSWAPKNYEKSANNKSSVDYNIISFQKGFGNIDKINSSNIFDRKLMNKKKSVCEYSDLTRNFAIHLDKNYQKAIKDNPKRFLAYNGVFTYLYNASHRNGNISMPFRKSSEINYKRSDS